LSSAVTLPALAGLAAVSDPLMATIGQKWIPAAGVLKILSLLGMLLIFAYFTGPLLQALSKPHQLAILEWARMAIGALVLIAAGFYVRNGSITQQIAGIAFARFFTGAFLVAPVFLYIFMRLCRISFRQLTATVAPSAASAASVAASVTLFHSSGLFATSRPAFLLASEVVIGGVVGLAVLFSLETQLRRSVAGILQRTLRRVAA
jgi:O-antigen/teichoic acid export membrane protein